MTTRQTMQTGSVTTSGPSRPEIRDAVRKVCGQFEPAYWRARDQARQYLTAFVQAMTEAGFSGVDPRRARGCRPRSRSRGGDPGGGPTRRLRGGGLPCPNVCHGHSASPWKPGAEGAISTFDRVGRIAAAGLPGGGARRRHRHRVLKTTATLDEISARPLDGLLRRQ